jgi:hypothetical protein
MWEKTVKKNPTPRAWILLGLLMASCVNTTHDCDNCPLKSGELTLKDFPISIDGTDQDTADGEDTDLIDEQVLADACGKWMDICPAILNEWNIYSANQCVEVLQCSFDFYPSNCDMYLADMLFCVYPEEYVDCESCEEALSTVETNCPIPADCLISR